MKSKTKICFRCKKRIILESEDYFAFEEYKKGKYVRTDYAHKECWDCFLKSISNTDEAMGLIRQLKGKLTNLGILEQEEYVVR